MRGSRRFARAAGSLLLAGVALACGRGTPPAPPAPEVVVAAVQTGRMPDRREYVGNVRALNEIELRARVRGYLIERRFTEGQLVAADEVLFRIDPKPFEVAVAEARGALARSTAAYELAKTELARTEELRTEDVVSASQRDARLEARDAAAAERQSAEAAVAAAELDLSYCTVRAPIAGRIGLALVDVGNLVGASGQDTVLAKIVQVDPVHVYFAPTELERLEVLRGAQEGRIPARREGIPIELRRGDGSIYAHPGTIDYVDPTVEPTRGTITVRALVPNPEDVLKPGEFVRVVVIFPDFPDATLVPERAVLEEQGGSYVLVVGDDSVVAYRRVRAGGTHDGLRRVVEGLAPGERVIVDGVQKARPGTTVSVKTAEAKTS
jgi:membrane fusion protein (multidrug efflux system)